MGDSSFLNVTLLSAQGLKDVCTFGKMSPYAKAWIDPSMKQRTPVASNAGCTPVWGHKISLPLPENALEDINLRLFIQVMSQGTATDTVVGSATILLGDIIRTTTPNGMEFMAVQLQRPSGRVQGLVNFSVEIADQSVKYQEPSTPSSSNSTELENPRDKTLGSNVRLPPDTDAVAKGPSAGSSPVTTARGRLLSGKEPLAAPDALGSGHSSVSLPESERCSQQIVEVSSSIAVDPLGPSKRGNSIGSSPFSPPIPASRGKAGNVAPDALDRSAQRPLGNATNSVDSPADAARGEGTSDTATPSFAHTMFGGLLGTLLMGEAISDSKGSVEHGGDYGHDSSDPGGNPSGVPHA